MPRFYKQHLNGFDLDLELPFVEIDGERCLLGSAGSLVLHCEDCGAERFRERASHLETCWSCPHHPVLKPKKLSDLLKWAERFGYETIPVEERRRDRIHGEELYRQKTPPWPPFSSWQFGTKTEADFPLGYVADANQHKDHTPSRDPAPTPYPWCRQPDICRGRRVCPHNPNCGE